MRVLLISLLSLFLLAFSLKKKEPVTIFLVGDSTVANKVYSGNNPEKGWGQVLQLYLNESVRVENHALNGRSTKSFIDEGHWDVVKKRIKKGDYVIIEFGHNDQKANSADRYADPDVKFPELLTQYISDVREKGGIPVLATPIVRRKFDERGYLLETHGKYPDAVRKVAKDQQVVLMDMHKRTRELLLRLGPERSKQLFLHYLPREYERFPNGIKDDTHLSGTGAFMICDLAIDEIKKGVPAIAQHLKK